MGVMRALPAFPQVRNSIAARAGRSSARQINIDTFEKVWTTIRDKHWEKNPGGLDWQAIHEEYRPRIDQAQNIDDVRAVLKEMLGRLHQTHFGILPATVYAAVEDFDAAGDGSTGIDLARAGWPGRGHGGRSRLAGRARRWR